MFSNLMIAPQRYSRTFLLLRCVPPHERDVSSAQTFLTTRVNGAVLDQFVGQLVCIVGKVLSHEEGAPESQIEASVRLN